MSETSSRLLTLLSLLQARTQWSGPELAGRLEVSERTVRRDVDRLRRLGYPVESVTGPGGCYSLRAGAAMPPLLLDDEEAVAIGVGLSTAARAAVEGVDEAALRALVKLEQVLPKRLRPRLNALATATTTVEIPSSGPLVDSRVLTAAAAACRDHERLRFAYRDREGAESRREVEPSSLVNLGRRWYMVAWDPAREGWRCFRIDRMSDAELTAVRFTPRELPAPDAASFVERSISTAPARYEARVVVRAPAEQVAARSYGGWGTVTPIDDESCELETKDDDLDWLAIRVAMIGSDFEVIGPPELKAKLSEVASRIAKAVGG